ncbi:MAG: PH domain-containing protein [Actinobacteria bacterium]|jgi:uncharacterized membrane protein YdbT with pleckstrin-like domain|nr:PH domain-containing protein [Actinomycetota bacterium]MCL6095363.1 PH domain-containing protein [Actinomycetota bacterium]
MSYSRRWLNEDEQVVVDLLPHWDQLLPAASMLMFSVAVLVSTVLALPHAPIAVGYLLVAFTCVAALRFLVVYLRWRSTRIILTSSRFSYRQGILARRSLDIVLARLNDVSFAQSIADRLLGSGKLYLETGGEKGSYAFAHIRHPASLQSIIYEQIDELKKQTTGEGVHATTGPLRITDSIPDQIAKLDRLRQLGIITEEEFASKKHQLLDRL